MFCSLFLGFGCLSASFLLDGVARAFFLSSAFLLAPSKLSQLCNVDNLPSRHIHNLFLSILRTTSAASPHLSIIFVYFFLAMADQTGLEFIAVVAIITFCLVLCLRFSLVLLRGNVYLLCTVIPVVFLVLAILREFKEALHIRLAKEISDPAARAKRYPERRDYQERRYREHLATREAHEEYYKKESERLWQEEQERVLRDYSQPRAPRYGRETSNLAVPVSTVFAVWRKDCRTLLQTPELITKMPLPPHDSCPRGRCNLRSDYLKICSHRLKQLYIDSNLEEKELKAELRLWHPNGARVNQVSGEYREKVLGIANEIVQVLQEILEDLGRMKNNLG